MPPLVEHCLELLAPLGPVRHRRMFGGWGFYIDDVFCALIAYERLYLKANDTTRPRFEAAGSEPFIYTAPGREPVSLGYWSAPAEAMDAPALMAPWARLAMQAALAARTPKAAVRKPAAAKRAARPAATSTPPRPKTPRPRG